MEEDYRMWKDLPCSWIGRINTVKMVVLPKAFYMFSAILIKIPMTFIITEIEKIYPKVHLETSNAGGITIPNFELYYRAIAIKTTWYWHKNRYEDRWNRIEDPDMNSCIYAHLIFHKGAKTTQW
jgi:hypothetical protein